MGKEFRTVQGRTRENSRDQFAIVASTTAIKGSQKEKVSAPNKLTYQKLLEEYERLRSGNAELQSHTVELQVHNVQLQKHNAELQAVKSQLQEKVSDYQQRLAEAERLIAFFKRQVFGSKAERLNCSQQEQIQQLMLDLQLQALRPAPISEQVLQQQGDHCKRKNRTARRRARHALPANLETETVTIQPALSECPCCGQMPGRIGEEVTEEIDLIPAKVIRRRIVRPKYACRCGGAGVAIAALPARLIPQSRLGLGLAVHVLLSRFDDHLSYYWIEKQFRERYGVEIPRQQMVQWIEQIAVWLKPIYEAMWNRMHAGGYLQIDETPVKVLDPEIKGRAAQGYLWFYAVPGGDVSLVFDRSRGLAPVAERMNHFSGTIQTDAYEVYQSLKRRQPEIERIGCLAHARRRFYAVLQENNNSSYLVYFPDRAPIWN